VVLKPRAYRIAGQLSLLVATASALGAGRKWS
jgi:hypothetical protein